MVEAYKYVVAGTAQENPTDPQSEAYQAVLYREAVSRFGFPVNYDIKELRRRTLRNYVVITKDRVAQRIIRGPFLSGANAEAAAQDWVLKVDAYYEWVHEFTKEYPHPEFNVIYGLTNCLEEIKDENITIQFPPDVSIETIKVERTGDKS